MEEDNKNHPLWNSLRFSMASKNREENIPIIGFQDHKKVDGVPNVRFPLDVTSTIPNQLMVQILIDNGISCKIMILDLFRGFGLYEQDHMPYEEKSILAFNDSSTHPPRFI